MGVRTQGFGAVGLEAGIRCAPDMGDGVRSNSMRNRARITRRNIHGRVAHVLGERIVRGELAPGSLLPAEAELSRLLGVSRTALREALKLMAAKGLLESRPKAGTRVRPRADWHLLDPDVLDWQFAAGPAPAFLRTLREVLRAVTPAVAALAAQHRSIADLNEMWAAVHAIEDAPEHHRDEARVRFDFALYAAARNELLAGFASLAGRVRAGTDGGADPGAEARLRLVQAVSAMAACEAERAGRALADVEFVEFERDISFSA